jgi:hypothetical protein
MESFQGGSQETEAEAIPRLPAGDQDNSLTGIGTPVVCILCRGCMNT